ncbi:MAG: hypothetical protein ACOXZ9_06210 [Bacteroidales bacterium]|jgi:hypothetical protein
MKKTLLFTCLFIFCVQLNFAQTEKSFPQYIWINANSEHADGSRFGYLKDSFTLINKNCHSLPTTDPCYDADEYSDYTLLGRYKNSSMGEHVNIIYSPGPSVDPAFYITDKNNNPIWSEAAEEMCINSNGIIYISGNINKMFNQRKKLKLNNNNVTEVEQPFYYVDVKGKLLKPVKLYSQKNNKGELVATLPVGYEIEILLAEPVTNTDEYGMPKPMMNYLARTAFGLVGWLRLGNDDISHMSPVVRGLGFLGD